MLALVLAAQIVMAAPPLPPAEAAEILAGVDSPANMTGRFVCTDCDGPHVVLVPSEPGAGPFGRFPPFRPRRRLDGTLLSQPPWSLHAYSGRRRGRPFGHEPHRPLVFVGSGRGAAWRAQRPGWDRDAGGVSRSRRQRRR